MGTGWRRAFCTSIPRDPSDSTTVTTVTDKQTPSPSPSPSPRSSSRFKFLSIGSNSSTPRLQSQQQSLSTSSSPSLRCRTTMEDNPKLLHCTTTTTKSPKIFQSSSNPSSPKSSPRFSLFKRLSKSNCGLCLQSVKTGQGMAIFTAECSHAFHFPCIAAYVRKHGSLVCPVCSSNWRQVPLLESIKADDKTSKSQTPSLRNIKTTKGVDQTQTQNQNQNQRSSYNDDEPLLSPRFNPIPEADIEDEDEEIEEFQGFFVNPNQSSSNKIGEKPDLFRDLRNVEVKLLPVAAVVSIGRNHETYAVALKVKAPPTPSPMPQVRSNANVPLLDAAHRAPIDLVTVLDCSGSMTGAKLQMLKRAMRLVVSSLGSADRLSIIAFSSSPKRLLPLKRMTVQGQKSARRIIDRLVCGQGTSVGDALRKATRVLEDRRERNPVASIMLLSDGGQNDRPSSGKSANRQHAGTGTGTTCDVTSTRFAHVEIPVHESGFGDNCFSKEPAEDAFAKCVGGLLSVVVQDLRLQLGFSSGSTPAEIIAVYSCTGRPTALGSNSIRIGDLYAEEERELLLELRVPTVPVGAHHVMIVRCNYKDPSTLETVYGKEQALLVPRPHAVRSSDPKIERLRNLFVMTRAIAESRRLVDHNELSSAHHMLTSARALLLQSSTISSDEYLRGLEAEITELHWRRQQLQQIQRRRTTSEREPYCTTTTTTTHLDENGEPLTPTSAWRAAEQLAKVAIMRKSMNRVSDLHGFENARF